jgi:hypothetical protein
MVHYYYAVATANIVSMSHSNSSSVPEGEDAAAFNFQASQSMDLAAVLQLCCGNRRSGQITFRSGQSYGFVYIQHGHVLHAMCGVMEGEDAIYRMLSWPEGLFSLDQDILPHKKTVTLTWEQLLFEGARRADDADEGAGSVLTTPVVTAEPVTSTRIKDSLPKLTLILPDQSPLTYELEAEYTHVGRASGNEVPLPYASVSNRHCIFILSGSDVLLRDLNSSNGTVVNGQAISETILRPGDLIQVGAVQIKFEPGVRRPKLTQTSPTGYGAHSDLREVSGGAIPSRTTAKLPNRSSLPTGGGVKDDSAFVKGESPISYENLAKPEQPSKRPPPLLLVIGAGVILVLALLGGGYYYFVILHR